jgi:GTP-binding protein LepA
MNKAHIRNFAIIAHIDHGKSTLADRLLDITHTIPKEQLQEQYLDSNPISRERGITIKLAPVRMNYELDGIKYELNLIDTPGHVDFSYEVVRTMNACEGAILLVDATKGVQAQTIANFNFAKRLNLTIIPVINKIDLPSANVEKVLTDMESLGFVQDTVLKISAKTGEGVEQLLQEVIRTVPPPSGDSVSPTQALIFDSVYDDHKGIVIYIRVMNGTIKKGDEIIFLSDNSSALVMDTGYMKPTYVSSPALANGEVGYVITNIKDITQAKVGDTITIKGQNGAALPGYQPLKPFVFLSIYPLSNAEFQNFRKALHTLKLTDASLIFTPEQSSIFGPGFRCGFLGLLHAQIVIERLEREFNLDVFTAPPSIEYEVDGEKVSNPKDFDISKKDILEPFMLAEIYTPHEYLGAILELIYARRGEQQDIAYYGSQVRITFLMPLSNVIYDFFDKVKSVSSGFASFDYEFYEYRPSDLVRVDISVNDQVIPELSFIVHSTESEYFGRRIVELLAKEIPKHQFVIAVRANIGSRVIASEKIAALSKNVTAKLYGGDVTRKNKLLDKQKEGKKKMKMIGKVSVPKEAFLSVLKV